MKKDIKDKRRRRRKRGSISIGERKEERRGGAIGDKEL